MKRLPIILILAICSLFAISSVARTDKKQLAKRETTDKADYIFLEALRQRSQGNIDAAFELVKRAHQLNPKDKEIGLELSMYLLPMADGDSVETARGLELLRSYWDANPSDYESGIRYGIMSQRMLNRPEALRVWRTLHTLYPTRSDITNVLAQTLAEGGDNADRNRAIGLFDSLEVTEGPSIELSSKKMQLYLNENDTAAVEGEIQRLLKLKPADVSTIVFAGQVYSMLGDPKQALDLLNKAVETDPSSGYAYFARAQYYKQQNDSANYDKEVFQALEQNNLDVDTKLTILRSYIQEMYNDSTQMPRIRELFDVLIDQHPLEHDIHDHYARYLVMVKDYKGAAEQEEQTLGLNPADPEGWQMLTSLYLQTEDYDKAEDAAKRSLRYYPNDPQQTLMLGSLYAQRKEYDKAERQYNIALGLVDSTNVELLSQIYTSMGDNLYAQEKPDSAFVLYKKAIAYNPNNYLALNNCAYFLACQGKDLDNALAMIEKVIKAEPDQATSLDTYAWVLFKRKEYQKAREAIDRTLEVTDERSEDILEHAGDIYFMDGEPDKALEFWKEALPLAPDNELLKRKVKEKTYFYK